MLEAILRRRRVTSHPAPDLLVPYALGANDLATARHVEECATCRAEIDELQTAAGLLRGSKVLEDQIEAPNCLDEWLIADFVDGRLSRQDRASATSHLISCARCRAVVKATSDLATTSASVTPQVRARGYRWTIPAGLAAAAVLVLLLLPRGQSADSPNLRESAVTSTVAPVPHTPAPGASVARIDRLVWSSVPGAERYRVRLYDGAGSVLWSVVTADTFAALPDSVRLQSRVPYFWRIEAEAAWMRWASSELASFQINQPR